MAIVKEEIVGTLIKNIIKSSNLKNTTYDTVNKTLLVTFNNDQVYEYYDVPHSEYTKFRMSESQGQYFSKNIAKKYKYAKK
jgi:hypothetical protein